MFLPPVPAGYYTRRGDANPRRCEAGSFSTGGAGECSACPPFSTTRNATATSANECLCDAGHYHDGASCVLCPAGRACFERGLAASSASRLPPAPPVLGCSVCYAASCLVLSGFLM